MVSPPDFNIRTVPQHWMHALLNRRELLWMLIERDIKTRYKQSILGLYWAIVEPLTIAMVFTVVFSIIVRIPTGDTPYVVFLLSGLLPWTFFANSINSGAQSIVRNPALITKVYFPREVLSIAAVLARLLDLAVSLAILVGIMLFFRIYPQLTIVFLPLIVLLHLTFALGLALVVSAANVFYRDVNQLIGIIMMLWMYLSPVLYPVTMVPQQYQWLFQLNPMVTIIAAYRAALLGDGWPEPAQTVYAAAISIAVLLLGYVYFKRQEPTLADVV